MAAPPTVFSQQEKGKPIHRRSCCCCTCLCCCIILLVVMVAIALLLFFMWPRLPDVEFLGTQQLATPTVTASAFNGRYSTNVQVNNDNYASWQFNQLTAQVTDKVSGEQIGKGEVNDVWILKRAVQNISVPFEINYSGPEGNPIVKRLTAVCMTPQTPMDVTIAVKLIVYGLSWIYEPTITRDVKLTCPK